MKVDQHVHSKISHDGISTMSEHIEYAKEHNISEITFTEHFDDYTGIITNIKQLKFSDYRNEYLKNVNNGFVKINYGIEIGLRPESYNLINNVVKENDFDFIIGSSHITCGKDMAYDKSFFEGLTPHQAVTKYLNEVLQNVKIYKNEFDVYGHIDYVIRYIIKNYGSLMTRIDYNDFRDLLDKILISIIKSDRGIEINTSGLRYNLGEPHPNIDILKRYKELGGKIITIGSDAHKASDLASNFDMVYDMLESIGYEEQVIYHNRIPSFVKIKKLR